MISMSDDLLKGPESGFTGAFIERDHVVAAILTAAFDAFIDKWADLDEFEAAIRSLYDRRLITGHAHDDDVVIAQLADIKLLTDTGAEGGDEVADLLRSEDLVLAGLFDIEDLAAQGQNGLEAAVARALRRAARGIALDQVDLAEAGIALGAVG